MMFGFSTLDQLCGLRCSLGMPPSVPVSKLNGPEKYDLNFSLDSENALKLFASNSELYLATCCKDN